MRDYKFSEDTPKQNTVIKKYKAWVHSCDFPDLVGGHLIGFVVFLLLLIFLRVVYWALTSSLTCGGN